MPEDSLRFLGHAIHTARKKCGLTQQELADQTGLAVKTVQDIEKGCKNTTYDTLARLIQRLGISADELFPFHAEVEDEMMQKFMGKFRSCSPEHQKILLETLYFLAEQFIGLPNQSETE